MGSDVFKESNYVTIYGEEGSYVETYANNNDIPFKNISEKPSEEIIEDGITENGLKYTKYNNEIVITGYEGNDEVLVIPSEIDGGKVKTIGNGAFEGNNTIKEVTISEGIKSIQASAFQYCYNLTKVNMGSSVEKIGDEAYFQCSKLKDVKLSEGLKKIGSYTFSYCSELESIKIPSSISKTSDSMFVNCTNLKNVEMEEGLIGIGDNSFLGCISLEKINLPKSIETIGYSAFKDCSELKEFEIPEKLQEIKTGILQGCKNIRSIKVPNSVTSINRLAFSGCTKLTSIEIPSSVEYMGSDVFKESNYITIYGEEGSYAQTYANENDLKFVPLKDIVKVKFNSNNGEGIIEENVLKGTALDYIPETPIKKGYTFVGWYKDINDTTTEYKNNTTYTDDITYTAKWAHVEMLGAQGKTIVNDKSGIRFGTKIYNDGDEIVEKGTLIIPVRVLGNQKLTLQNKNAAKSVANTLYDQNKEENYITYLGTLVGIPRSQFGLEITASAYIIYKDKAGNKYTVYSPYKNGSTNINQLLKL